MTRTSSTIALFVTALATAVAAVPAVAADGYGSVNAITGPTSHVGSSSGTTSINAQLGADAAGRSSSVSPESASSSVNALLSASGDGRPSSTPGTGDARSIKAILGERDVLHASSAPIAEVRESGGFRWGDALLGGLVASLLLLAMLAASRPLARHRRATLASRA